MQGGWQRGWTSFLTRPTWWGSGSAQQEARGATAGETTADVVDLTGDVGAVRHVDGMGFPSQESLRPDGGPIVDLAGVAHVANEVRATLGRTPTGSVSMADRLRASLDTGMTTGLIMQRYDVSVENMRNSSPRILLVGDSGVGKSTTVNIVFGLRAGDGGADVRAGGRPCTQHFAEYGPTDRAPVRVVDTMGTERLRAEEQMAELRWDIEEASASPDDLDHVHLCWYFVGERWQEADKILVKELMRTCGVIVVLSKRDQRTGEWVRNTTAAITADLGMVKIAEVGDPRGTRNWIPESCECGHGEDYLKVNYRQKRWNCQFDAERNAESSEEALCKCHGSYATSAQEDLLCLCHGDDSPFGHAELVHMSVDLLPVFLRQSFLTAQRVDLYLKHMRAAAIVVAFAVSAAGIGACPVPFADLPALIALEVLMAAKLISEYGIPLNVYRSEEMVCLHGSVIGFGSALGYGAAQLLKAIPGLGIAGTSIDMIVAGSAVATLGIAMCVVLTKFLKYSDADEGEARRMIETVAGRVNTLTAFRAVATGAISSIAAQESFATIIQEQSTPQRLRDL